MEFLKENQVPSEAFRIQILTLLPAYHNFFMTGCTIGWIPNAIYFLQYTSEVPISFSQSSLIASSSQLGRLITALPSGYLVDKVGRKKMNILAGLIHFFSWLILSLSSSLLAIVTARFALGVAMSVANSVSLISVGEIASPGVRGRLISILQLFFSFGCIFLSIISVTFSSYFFMSYFCLAISFLYFFTLFWIIETPYFLASISEVERAKVSLKTLRPMYTEEEVKLEFNKLLLYVQNESKLKSENNWLKFLRFESIRKPLIIAVILNLLMAGQGSEVLFSYITAFIPDNRYISKQYYPLCALLLDFGITLIVPFYVDKLPRRTIFMTGAGIMAVNYTLLALIFYGFEKFDSEVLRWIFIVVNGLDSIVMGGTIQPMSYATMSEILPQTVKGLAASFCAIAQSLVNVNLYFLFALLSQYDFFFMFLLFATNSIILFFFLYCYLPEGRAKYLDELQKALTTVKTTYGSV